jgi:hypothetical protein
VDRLCDLDHLLELKRLVIVDENPPISASYEQAPFANRGAVHLPLLDIQLAKKRDGVIKVDIHVLVLVIDKQEVGTRHAQVLHFTFDAQKEIRRSVWVVQIIE